VLTVLTGVAGSGKSSLITGSVAGREGVVWVDQTAIKGSRRSNPATYTGLLEPIRKAFAKVNGVKPALFSANSEGACPTCNGAGVIYTDLAMMAGVASTCEECEGKRFSAAVLDYTLAGKNISEVLEMPVARAEEFFGAGESRILAAHKILQRLVDVGLGYITLGQPLTTLSGGERQRLKLASQMADKGQVYILDEPTTGLRSGSGCRSRRRAGGVRGHSGRSGGRPFDTDRHPSGRLRRGVAGGDLDAADPRPGGVATGA
jgi:excinuclease UvrABC ATPase subunit